MQKLVFVAVLLFVATFLEESSGIEKKGYSEIKQAIRDGKVKKIWMNAEILGAELNDSKSTQWVAERIGDDQTLIPLLEEKN